MLSEINSPVPIGMQNQDPCPRRPGPRNQRPTNLLMGRNRSESPVTRSKSRPSDIGSSPATDVRCDLDALRKKFEDSNGVLNFGDERIVAKKEDFEYEKDLGSGHCSVVWKMRHRRRRDLVMAVKVMRMSSYCEEENKLIFTDLNVVTQSNKFRFIVNCYGIFFTTLEFWICMELMPTCLEKLSRDLARPFPEDVIGTIVVSIISALNYLKQRHNVMHRDVKPSNMLLGYRGEVKLCDFGISGKLKDSIAQSGRLGCIRYMAPERLKKQKYDVRADVWSLGVSIFELATGSFPYSEAKTEFALMTKIMDDAAPTLPPDSPVSEEFRLFLETCLKKDVSYRPKYPKLMQYEFFRIHNVEPLNVLEWLQTLDLPHLRQSITCTTLMDIASANGPTIPTTLGVNPTTAASSPASTATLSPTQPRTFAEAAREDSSFEANEPVEHGDSRRDAVNVALVAAPAVHLRRGSDLAALTNGVNRVELRDLAPGKRGGDGALAHYPMVSASGVSSYGDSLVAHNTDSHLHKTQEPLSQASSGYGSVTSHSSGHSVDCTSKPHSEMVFSNRSRHYRQPVVKVPDSVAQNKASGLVPTDHDSVPFRPHTLPRRIAEQPSSESDHWIASSSCSRTTQQVSTQPPTTVIAPQRRRPEQTNRNGSETAQTVSKPGPSDRSLRSYTPPVASKISRTPKPSDNPPAFPVNDGSRQTTSQSRSASAGAQLRRSHARRWQPKPGSPSPPRLEPSVAASLCNREQPHRPSDLVATRAYGPTKSGSTSSNLAPQQYHHHYYYYYYYTQQGTASPVSPRAVTPPLPPRGLRPGECLTSSPTITTQTPPTSKNGLHRSLTGRLACRLYTHPLPRQNICVHALPAHPEMCAQPRNLHHTNPSHSSVSSNLDMTAVHPARNLMPRIVSGGSGNDSKYCDKTRQDSTISKLLRGSHRSSSQPANPHDWLSFETEL